MTPSHSSSSGPVDPDDSAFVKLFSKKGRVKAVDVFLKKPYSTLSVSQIIDQAGISRSTFHRNVDPLIEMGIVYELDDSGPGSRYQLNRESELTELMGRLRIELIKHSEHLTDKSLRNLPVPDRSDLANDRTDENADDHGSGPTGDAYVSERLPARP